MNRLIKVAAVAQTGVMFATIFAWPYLFPVALFGLFVLWLGIMPDGDA